MQGALAGCFKRFLMVTKIVMVFFGSHIKRIIADTKINGEYYSIELVESYGKTRFQGSVSKLSHYRRIKRETNRKDFYTRILENRVPDTFSNIQLAAHASDFVLAGSETSST